MIIQSITSTKFNIEVSSEKFAMFVWLEVGNITGKFSENGFHVLQNKKNIVFKAVQPATVEELKKNIIVTSLSQIYDYEQRTNDLKPIIDIVENVNK